MKPLHEHTLLKAHERFAGMSWASYSSQYRVYTHEDDMRIRIDVDWLTGEVLFVDIKVD